MLSSYLFFCLPRLLPPFTVPYRMFLVRPEERETSMPLQFASLYGTFVNKMDYPSTSPSAPPPLFLPLIILLFPLLLIEAAPSLYLAVGPTDRPGVCKVPKGSGEQGKMEKTGCKIICGAPTTLAVKGLMMMMMRRRPYGLVPKGLLTFLGSHYKEVAKTTPGTLV